MTSYFRNQKIVSAFSHGQLTYYIPLSFDFALLVDLGH